MKYFDLVVLGSMLTSYFGVHSLLADLKVKSFLIGRIISQKYYRLFYNIISILLLLPIAWIYFKTSANFLFKNEWLSYIGLSLIPLGLVLIGLSFRQYNLSEFSGLEQLMEKKGKEIGALRVAGLNAIVRHPLYTSSLILLWGWFLFRPTDVVLVVVMVTTMYIYFGTKLEEQKLVKEFGADYIAYQKEVNMLIPFI